MKIIVISFLLINIYRVTCQPNSPIISRPVKALPTTPLINNATSADYHSSIIRKGIPYSNCSSTVPRIPKDCTSIREQDKNCCYLYPNSGGIPFCYNINSKELQPYMTKLNLNGSEYNLDCGGLTQSLVTCGVGAPKSHYECTSHSTIDNSCCFYQNEKVSYCFWFGSIARQGRVTSSVNCRSHTLKFKFEMLLVIIILVLLH